MPKTRRLRWLRHKINVLDVASHYIPALVPAYARAVNVFEDEAAAKHLCACGHRHADACYAVDCDVCEHP